MVSVLQKLYVDMQRLMFWSNISEKNVNVLIAVFPLNENKNEAQIET